MGNIPLYCVCLTFIMVNLLLVLFLSPEPRLLWVTDPSRFTIFHQFLLERYIPAFPPSTKVADAWWGFACYRQGKRPILGSASQIPGIFWYVPFCAPDTFPPATLPTPFTIDFQFWNGICDPNCFYKKWKEVRNMIRSCLSKICITGTSGWNVLFCLLFWSHNWYRVLNIADL